MKMDETDACKYIIHDSNGLNRRVDDIDAAIGMSDGCNCTKLNIKKVTQRNKEGDQLFIDEDYHIEAQDIDRLQNQFQERIVLKRICRLYPKKHRPALFSNQPTKAAIPKSETLPTFIYEIQILGRQTFQKIILGSSISESGRYEIVVNYDGKYQIEVIDDIVPVFQKWQEPVWSRYLNKPWHFIIMKVWAKIKGGYSKLKQAKPFQFIQYFTQRNWKYVKLSTQGGSFLHQYKDKVGKKCRVLLKSKNSQKVSQSGLISSRISYELISIQFDKNYTLILMIRTFFENTWTGKSSIVDKSFKFTQKMQKQYKLNFSLTLTTQDFLNIFSVAYITHANLPLPIYRSFHYFSNPQKFKTARYFQINFSKEGFFNFSIQQPESNVIKISGIEQTKLWQSGRGLSEKFLPIKYILSRKINNQSSRIYLEHQTQIGDIGKRIRQTTSKFQQKYNQIQYELYQTAHRHGFGKSNAHFMSVIPGNYILRIKAESSKFQSNFVIHYSTNELTEIQEIFMTKEESKGYLDHNIVSISDHVPFQSFSKDNYQKFSVSDSTDTLGYGFAVLKLHKNCPYKIVIQVDPQQLLKQGYRLKNIYKQEKKPFKVEVLNGQSKPIVFKRVSDRSSYSWPSKAFEIKKIKL